MTKESDSTSASPLGVLHRHFCSHSEWFLNQDKQKSENQKWGYKIRQLLPILAILGDISIAQHIHSGNIYSTYTLYSLQMSKWYMVYIAPMTMFFSMKTAASFLYPTRALINEKSPLSWLFFANQRACIASWVMFLLYFSFHCLASNCVVVRPKESTNALSILSWPRINGAVFGSLKG